MMQGSSVKVADRVLNQSRRRALMFTGVLFAGALLWAGQRAPETMKVRAAPPAIELTFERFVPQEEPEELPAAEPEPAPQPVAPEPEIPKVMTADDSPVTVEVPPEPEPEEVKKEPEPEPEPPKPAEAVKPPEVTPPPPEVKKPVKKAPAPVKKPLKQKAEKASPPAAQNAVAGDGTAAESKSTVDIAGESARAKTKNQIVSILAGLVDKAKRYPKSARRAAQEGVVQVAFTVSAAGRVTSAALDKGCEFETLNDASLDAAEKIVGTELNIPNAGMKVIVPIRYRLN
jgi:protein TonB